MRCVSFCCAPMIWKLESYEFLGLAEYLAVRNRMPAIKVAIAPAILGAIGYYTRFGICRQLGNDYLDFWINEKDIGKNISL